jgi:hypothetical protein
MNILNSLVLYLALFLVMIILALEHVLPVNYLGGIVIALFIAGLFYAWLNAWRQTEKLIKGDSLHQSQLEKEEREEETDYPYVLVQFPMPKQSRTSQEEKQEERQIPA